ncbi:ribonuclease H1 [Fusarium beomiforme]|uniref:Ribonuclease H n=1 Tax=Fusarium beomiforme TaxID=44412 RepID=A0A9P5DSG7_9HYPO|nr:ribonuclease H1 [Fusarium beomiforme]
MVKKRSAPGGGFGASSSSKMRKTSNATKFYAVKKGRKPGIYLNYDDCQAQTTKFPGAQFKSFKTEKEAQDYIDGKEDPSAAQGPPKFYAVAVGHNPGIYPTWEQARPQVTEVAGPKYKKFATKEDAEQFIRENASIETCQALGISLGQGMPSQEYNGAAFEPVQTSSKKAKTEPTATPMPNSRAELNSRAEPSPEAGGGLLKIYTDGSSLANGQAGSRAGLGVYFGHNDKRNLAERLPGEPQTNQRAELMAMLRALEIAPLTQGVQIWSDSQYSIKCVTQWAINWERKDWKTASGDEVKNQDIIRDVLAKINERTAAGSQTGFEWVKGHATDPGNHEADRLANIGSRMPKVG